MSIGAQQYAAPYTYTGLTVNGSGGAALTLRQMIVAATGVVPKRPITGFTIFPSAQIRRIGGYDVDLKTFVTAVNGGGYVKIPTNTAGITVDMSDPLDNVAWLMDGAGAGTMDVEFYLSY